MRDEEPRNYNHGPVEARWRTRARRFPTLGALPGGTRQDFAESVGARPHGSASRHAGDFALESPGFDFCAAWRKWDPAHRAAFIDALLSEGGIGPLECACVEPIEGGGR